MEYKGLKIDFIGLAAALGAIGTLYSIIKGNQKKKEAKDAEKDKQD